jgi:hypothetical protein
MTELKFCASCGCDISARFKTAKFCEACAVKANKEAKVEYNRAYRAKINEKARVKRAQDAIERIPAKRGRPKSHQPTPNSVIRAITPVMGELGDLSLGSRKEDRIREITPSPVIADQPYMVRPDKKTWVFPKTEKRFKELTLTKNNTTFEPLKG